MPDQDSPRSIGGDASGGRLAGKTALITGASSGIGRAIAEAFAAEGARLVLVGRTAARLAPVAEKLRAQGAAVVALPANVADEAEVMALFAQIDGALDILVNNAGTSSRVPTEEMSLAEWHRVIETNLTGAFLCAREAFKRMKPRGGGRILNIGSISAKVPRAHSAPYTASKFALEGLTRSLALDGRAHGIAVSVLQPGNTRSELWAGREQAAEAEGIMQAEDVARVAMTMASLPDGVNLLEAIILPVSMPFVGRG